MPQTEPIPDKHDKAKMREFNVLADIVSEQKHIFMEDFKILHPHTSQSVISRRLEKALQKAVSKALAEYGTFIEPELIRYYDIP